MDQGAKRMVYFEALEENQRPTETGNAVVDTLHLLRARAWVIALIVALGAVGGVELTLLQPPTFQAKATLEIQAPVENVFGMQGGAGTATMQPEAFLQTQVKTLESRTLQKRVIASLRAKDRLITHTPRDRMASWRKVLGVPVAHADSPARPTVPDFELKVRAFENADVVEILCDSPDPNFSADYVNTLTDEFMQLSLDSRWTSYQRTADWLGRQLGDLKKKLESSERELQAYSASSGLLFTDDKDSVQSDKLKQIQEELSRAQGDRVAKQAVYEVAMASSADAVPQVIDNERLSGYQIKMTELRREAADLSSLYTPEHYKVIRVKAELAEVQATFKRERDAVLTRIQNEFQSATRREKLLLAAYNGQTALVSAQAAKAIHYDVLKREVDTDRQLYGALLQKVKEASVVSALASSNMRVLDPAEPPSHPYKPSIVSNILKGIGAGLFVGVFLVVGGDRINRSLRAPGETPYHLKVPELGVIPSGASLPLRSLGGPPRTKQTRILLAEAETQSEERVELVTWQDTHSPLAESFRNTLASILLSSNGSRPRVILVTSASRAEGKSTTVSNLGLGLAEINQKILLIDADMRKPRLHHLFDLSNSWGLSDLLREKTVLKDSPIEALARPTAVSGLWVLPSGPGTLSISGLLYSERMAQLLDRFRGEFDTILIDTPPMLTISDARILGRLADGAILVIGAGLTTRDAALSAKQRLVEDGIPVIGTVLNRWDLKSKTRYGNQGYYYGPPS
jgi:succinoglycan biosynthesis transport protein ExoP